MEETQDHGHDDYLGDLGKIQTAGQHLLGLVQDVLDLAKIESGKMDVHLETFDVAALLQSLETTMAPLAAKHQNQLVVDTLGELGEMRSDLTKVRQVLLNLLSNACKFTQDGTVTLVASRKHRGDKEIVDFQVQDTGIGIAAEHLGKLFQPFQQANETISLIFGGTGLGLAICKECCLMMGGDISVESHLGRGATFTVELPVEYEKDAGPR